MARPTTFIQEQALDKAMSLFWRQDMRPLVSRN